MRILIWLLRFAVFVVLFGLAIKNSDSIMLRFYFEQAWQLPLALVILVAFVAGVAVGLSVMLAMHVSQRREIGKLRRTSVADNH